MISMTHWIIILLSSVFVMLAYAAPGLKLLSNDIGVTDDDNTSLMNKRGWKDVRGSWGKRAWDDLQGTWGKRGWERLNGAWGKRLTLDAEPEVEEYNDRFQKRPEWSNLKGSWGKRTASSAGWQNMKGAWGKRAWDKLGTSWGKRSENDDELPMLNELN